MGIIDLLNINAVDLNLLRVFAALYRERHVTRAAASVGLAQPSMSNALARLRYLLDDPLFVRSPDGMIPTERADLLAPRITVALDLMADALQRPEPFDPRTARAEIVISCSDSLVLSHGPALIARLQAVAPGLVLRTGNLDKDAVWHDLDQGRVDVAMGIFDQIPARFEQTDFLTDTFVCIARINHPQLVDDMDLATFLDLPHILMTLRRDMTGAVDSALDSLGHRRRVVMTVTQFGVVPEIIGRTDCIATIPLSVAVALAQRSGCSVYPAPIALPSWKTKLVWSAATAASPAKRFTVEIIRKIAEETADNQDKIDVM